MDTKVTLLSDFGTQDGYAGAIKGLLISRMTQGVVLDISHQIEPQNVWQAAMCLKRYARQYPANTVHLVVVDPGVGSMRKALALKCDDHWLIGPDNGVLSLAAQDYHQVKAYALHPDTPWWKKHHSFDGLALFAPAAAELVNGRPILEMATALNDYHKLTLAAPELINNILIGQIISFDRFGNAVTNLSPGDLPKNLGLEFKCRGHSFPLTQCYSDGPGHGRLAIVNSDRLIELAYYQGSAHQELELTVGDTVSLILD